MFVQNLVEIEIYSNSFAIFCCCNFVGHFKKNPQTAFVMFGTFLGVPISQVSIHVAASHKASQHQTLISQIQIVGPHAILA